MSLLLLFGGGGTPPSNMSAAATNVLVAASVDYTARAEFRAATDARDCRVLIRWYNGAGGLISTSTGVSVADSTSGWTAASVSATSPSTATYASVVVEVLDAIAAEVHYVDKIGLFQGASPTWVPHA